MSRHLRSVLIVEDDLDLRQAVAELIEDEGYECRHASGGIDLLARLRERPSYRDIPVIAMTAANDRMLGVKLDVPVLQKPIDLSLLSKMLARYCPLDENPAGPQPRPRSSKRGGPRVAGSGDTAPGVV